MKLAAMILLALPVMADVDVMVDGAPRAKYAHNGTTYVEAIRGQEFALRLTNPTSERVAVALSVDGLNTIDAKHTGGWNAAKWVLDPYESVEISGWQVSDRSARRFFFTGERSSYGAALGKTANLGVIEAIFYRERRRPIARYDAAPAPSASARSEKSQAAAPSVAAEGALSDEYAATGMGDRTRHDVTRVDVDLDPTPVATARIRYEFRPQLIKLGVLDARPSRLERREKARGFEGYCPEP
ncbi:MAG TPA: hypothetical protein VEK57_03265 [Thermoanaerobaculia bacterium]|nr:hypothetical protein [Thermoanaerobaculia bacterium]